jgi:hypothetical protein
MNGIDQVTIQEMKELFTVRQQRRRETAWVKDFELSNGYRKEFFAGRLTWDENYGYNVIWDTDVPEIAHRPEFEYVLDCITNDSQVPQYGDLSDAGMDGA